MSRLAVLLLAAAALRGCVAYEYEHEFWVRVDGSGTVNVTGRPELWTAFKGVTLPADEDATRDTARRLFDQSGQRDGTTAREAAVVEPGDLDEAIQTALVVGDASSRRHRRQRFREDRQFPRGCARWDRRLQRPDRRLTRRRLPPDQPCWRRSTSGRTASTSSSPGRSAATGSRRHKRKGGRPPRPRRRGHEGHDGRGHRASHRLPTPDAPHRRQLRRHATRCRHERGPRGRQRPSLPRPGRRPKPASTSRSSPAPRRPA